MERGPFVSNVELLDDGEGTKVRDDGNGIVSNVQQRRRRRRKRLRGRRNDGDALVAKQGERFHGNMVDSDPSNVMDCEMDCPEFVVRFS